jgi:hypothetical protein
LKNLPIGEGVLVRHPTGMDAEFWAGKGTTRVKRLVAHGRNHGQDD